MSSLILTVEKEEGRVPVIIISADGEIDANSYKSLQDQASELIDGGATNILIDLEQVTYMGSAGFRAFHAIANLLSDESSENSIKASNLKLLNPSPEVSKVIKTLGFDSYLDVHTDRKVAIDSFS